MFSKIDVVDLNSSRKTCMLFCRLSKIPRWHLHCFPIQVFRKEIPQKLSCLVTVQTLIMEVETMLDHQAAGFHPCIAFHLPSSCGMVFTIFKIRIPNNICRYTFFNFIKLLRLTCCFCFHAF